MQTTGDEMMVAEACRSHDHLRQRVVVVVAAYRPYSQLLRGLLGKYLVVAANYA